MGHVKQCAGTYRHMPLLTGLVLAGSVLVALMLIVCVAPAGAQDDGGQEELPPGVTWDDVNAIAHKMYCDVCEGVPLDECESAACRNWRREIARLLGEGYTEDEIIDHFVERYGADVAALPRNRADLRLVFIVPAAIVIVLGVIVAAVIWIMWQRGRQTGPVMRRSVNLSQARPVPDDVEPEYLERLARELEGLES